MNIPNYVETAKFTGTFIEYLQTHYAYNPDEGTLRMKKKTKPITTKVVRILGKLHQRARIVWAIHTGSLPPMVLTRDGDPMNIVWSNLYIPSERKRTYDSRPDALTYSLKTLKDTVRHMLRYDPNAGELTHTSTDAPIHAHHITVRGAKYTRGQIIWLIMRGYVPQTVKFRDRNANNIRFDNLYVYQPKNT